MFKLIGNAAIVTGGAAGIGLAIAKTLANAGASVLIVDIAEEGEERAKQLRAEGANVHFARADVRKAEQVSRAVQTAAETFGAVDILVNNAGFYPRAMLLDTTEELWDSVMELNLKSMFLFSKAAVPHMKERGGAIVNMSSSHAEVGLPELFAYSVSKGGVNTLTRNLANALARYRIRVNCVNPGWVATEKELAERAANGQTLDDLAEMGKGLPLGRMQTGEDTAAAVLYLVSDEASQVTGQFLNVDGGKSVMMFDDSSLEKRS